MRLRRITHWTGWLAFYVCLAPVGCASLTGFLNEDFLATLGATQSAATLPGEAPSVVVGVRNDTERPIEFLVSWRDGDENVEQHTLDSPLQPGASSLLAVFCPVVEVTLGDVSDLTATGAIIRLGNGGSNDPYIEVEPFGVLLQSGIHYDCGDRIVFSIRPSSATSSGYRVFAEITRSGAQTTEVTGN